MAPQASRRSALDAVLALSGWLGLLGPFVLAAVLSPAPRDLLLTGTGPAAERDRALFLMGPVMALILFRLVRLIVVTPERRAALILLLITHVQWMAAVVYTTATQGSPQPTTFPSASDAMFTAGLGSLVAYLAVDRRRNSDTSLTVWLDTAIASGGMISLTSLILSSPLASSAASMQPLFAVIDTMTLCLVLVQLVRRQRAVRPSGLLLLLSISCMIFSDSALTWYVVQEHHHYPVTLDVLWGVAMLVLGSAAARTLPAPMPAPTGSTPPPDGDAQGSVATLVMLLAATLVLAFVPPGPSRLIAVGPALVTLSAAIARLILGLRTAREAADAFRQSLTDDVTGLPNRRSVLTTLDDALATGPPIGLLLLDLNGFAEVNDTLGHVAGDDMLRVIGTRLRAAAPASVTVARLGADEFCLAYPDVTADDLTAIAARLRTVVRQSVVVAGLSLTLDATFGGVAPDAEIHDGGDLLRRGDIALTQARSTHLPYAAYDPEQDIFSRDRLRLGDQLREAIAGDQLELWYQPQVDLPTDTIASVEALVRWRHPERGLIPPGEFLDLARRFGLMPALTETTMRLAVTDAGRWHTAGLDLKVAMNVAPAELLTGGSMALLRELVTAAGLPGELFVVEVTEDSFLADRKRAQQVIEELHQAGFEVSVDDYGTGFSSLAYLRDLPLRELKIDRKFVAQIDTDERSAAIVSTTTDMAHALGMRIVAEGVETAAVVDALRTLGIDLAQGYFIARPMPAREVDDWIAAYHSRAARAEVDQATQR
ncbi:MAG: bifunctional diguanylate cyclase/phosphodiesterase [Kineosporiaceae bacterium]|nr:bifunctional diguanylate cyclase/phosphodiesterase [Kineosporiaceae bacterium]MBK7623690.1 bifunctional diguanylate cyclase/phosphodiesterase [Kineosporiaceae bacterium]MBK8078035.1 bifunctional diguanylate cyclase/phosphodiesterase [Kineosporiaceae bacterium]